MPLWLFFELSHPSHAVIIALQSDTWWKWSPKKLIVSAKTKQTNMHQDATCCIFGKQSTARDHHQWGTTVQTLTRFLWNSGSLETLIWNCLKHSFSIITALLLVSIFHCWCGQTIFFVNFFLIGCLNDEQSHEQSATSHSQKLRLFLVCASMWKLENWAEHFEKCMFQLTAEFHKNHMKQHSPNWMTCDQCMAWCSTLHNFSQLTVKLPNNRCCTATRLATTTDGRKSKEWKASASSQPWWQEENLFVKFVILGWQNTAEQADCDEENAKCTHACPCTHMCVHTFMSMWHVWNSNAQRLAFIKKSAEHWSIWQVSSWTS